MYPLSVKQTYLAVFNSSASSPAVPGLATDPFSILLGARRSTQVTSQTNCLPSSQGARVIPSGRFPSVRVRPYGSKIERTLMELSACFTRVLRLWCLEKRPASGTGKTMMSVLFDKFTAAASVFLANFRTQAEG